STLAASKLGSVSVPVLSNTAVSICTSVSKASGLITKILRLASTPMARVIAAGAAKPNAHGQATTNKAMVASKAWLGSYQSQPTKVNAVIINTRNTKLAVIRSLRLVSLGL